jgi:hypothetical protein
LCTRENTVPLVASRMSSREVKSLFSFWTSSFAWDSLEKNMLNILPVMIVIINFAGWVLTGLFILLTKFGLICPTLFRYY